jgi:hypothetical protein
MTTVEAVLQTARERVPGATPRIISDNGPQFIAKDLKKFIRSCTMTHVRTSPVYPQSNGKLERLTKSLKGECVRPTSPVSLSDARGLVATYVEHYNTVRLHSAIGYVTPQAKLEGRERAIFAERQRLSGPGTGSAPDGPSNPARGHGRMRLGLMNTRRTEPLNCRVTLLTSRTAPVKEEWRGQAP